MAELHVHDWGEGEPVLLVHGSMNTGAWWAAQRPLARQGFRLRALDRRGYGASAHARGEDFAVDADDLAWLLDRPSHVVGHSYGAIGALLAAARAPHTVRSLALIEPPLFALPAGDGPAAATLRALDDLWARSAAATDREFLTGFMEVMGEDTAGVPEASLDAWAAVIGPLRHGRPGWHAELPLDALAQAPFPTVVFSGGHSAAFEAVCDTLAERIGARREVLTGAGHAVATTGDPFNAALVALWRTA